MKESLSEASYQFSTVFVNMLWPLWAIGIIKTLQNFLSVISFHISGRVIEKYKELKTLAMQFMIDRILNITAYAFPTVVSPILLASSSITYGISQVAESSLMQKEFTDKQRATMGSLDSIVVSLGFAIGSIAIGFLADIFGPAKTLLLAQILLLPGFLLYRKMFSHEKSVMK